MPQVSLILAVRADESILRRCITAVNAQTYADFELVLADASYDGYTKALERKLDCYPDRVRLVESEPDIDVWHQLRRAVEAASGRYIIFLDPAQWLEDDTLAMMVGAMENYEVDMAEMRTVKCINGVAVRTDNPVPSEVTADTVITGDRLRAMTAYIGRGSYISPSIYDKIYLRELLVEALAPDCGCGSRSDELLNIQYLRHARSVVLLSFAGLNYNWQDQQPVYRYSALDDAKAAFRFKSLCCQDSACIREELKGRLERHAHGLIVDNGWTREATLHFLRRELADPFWRQAAIDVTAEELVEAVVKRDRWHDLATVLSRLFR